MNEMNDDLEKKDKSLEEAENDMVEQKKLYSDLGMTHTLSDS